MGIGTSFFLKKKKKKKKSGPISDLDTQHRHMDPRAQDITEGSLLLSAGGVMGDIAQFKPFVHLS